MGNYDFSGYATRNDLVCGDGRVIRKNAFIDNDGREVPLVWNHQHNSPEDVLGHALLENREDGVYAYCTLNDTESGKLAKKLVQHGDIRSLSIYANKLKQIGGDVIHGVIRELSLVHAGANSGAFIDQVMAHSDDGEEVSGMIIGYDENIMLYHSAIPEKEDPKKKDEPKKEKKEDAGMPNSNAPEKGEEKTVADVFNELTDEQKDVVYAMIGQALEEGGADNEENGGNEEMKHNVFDADTETGDFYDVFCIEDGNEKFLCAIPYNINIDDDDTVIKEIDDAIDWVEYKDENDMYSQDDDLEDFDNFEDDDLDESYEDDDLEDEPKYSLIGCDGNAYAVMGYVTNCMKKEGKTREEIKAYQEQAMSRDYDNLLAVSCEILDELNEK